MKLSYERYITDPDFRATIEARARRERAEQLRRLWAKFIDLWKPEESRLSRWLAVRGR
jgi:hypothetical protein